MKQTIGALSLAILLGTAAGSYAEEVKEPTQEELAIDMTSQLQSIGFGIGNRLKYHAKTNTIKFVKDRLTYLMVPYSPTEVVFSFRVTDDDRSYEDLNDWNSSERLLHAYRITENTLVLEADYVFIPPLNKEHFNNYLSSLRAQFIRAKSMLEF